jgi:hypothetical protein
VCPCRGLNKGQCHPGRAQSLDVTGLLRSCRPLGSLSQPPQAMQADLKRSEPNNKLLSKVVRQACSNLDQQALLELALSSEDPSLIINSPMTASIRIACHRCSQLTVIIGTGIQEPGFSPNRATAGDRAMPTPPKRERNNHARGAFECDGRLDHASSSFNPCYNRWLLQCDGKTTGEGDTYLPSRLPTYKQKFHSPTTLFSSPSPAWPPEKACKGLSRIARSQLTFFRGFAEAIGRLLSSLRHQ